MKRTLLLSCVGAVSIAAWGSVHTGGQILVDAGSSTRYLANAKDPGIGKRWIEPDFEDGSWPEGWFGIGRESGSKGGARALLRTRVPAEARSVYTRTHFVIDDVTRLSDLHLGLDYDDGYVAWLNGVEVQRSASMPGGTPAWDSSPESHESSNGASPRFNPLRNISAAGIPLLKDGANVLAIGVWDKGRSSDLVVVPRLIANQPLDTFVTRGPYLQSMTDSSVIVRWRTDKPTDSRVAFGAGPNLLDRAVTSAKLTTRHSLRIEGLLPETKVYYSVGTATQVLAGGDTDHAFKTAPRPGSRVPVRVWVIGDSGTAGFRAGSVREGFKHFSAGRDASLWLMLGDNAYPKGTDSQYQKAMFETYEKLLARIPVFSAMGNHDGVESVSPPVGPFYEIFDHPSRGEAGGVASGSEDHYAFDFANIHFVCLNSEIPQALFASMLEWLRRDLAATKSDWIIGFWHHSPYGTGSHDSDTAPRMIAMREKVLPILDAGGVDLVLTGHMHAYSRSPLLRGHYGPSSSLTLDSIVDGGDGRVEGTGAYRKIKGKQGHRGIVYVVAGSSGEATEGRLRHPALLFGLKQLGSVVLDVEGDRLDASFVDDEGEVRDLFTIVKQAAQTRAGIAD